MNDDVFDLTERPWIPCETSKGELVELGLRDVLARAHELRAVSDSSPLVTAALHRLLLAVVHRVFGPPNIAAWKALYQADRFDERALSTYLDTWRHRLRLFDPERPFYQVRALPFAPDPVARLVFERSNYGAAVSLFQHGGPKSDRLSPAEAARGLVALQLFAPGGLVKKRGEPDSATAAPLNRGAMTLLTGKTLKETLLLNSCVYAPEEGRPIVGDATRDRPAWERSSPAKIERRRPDGWLDLLTWQSRRLELARDEAGLVSGVTYCVGQDLDDEAGHKDPMLAYRLDAKRGWVAIEFREERVIWRDSHALVRTVDAAHVEPPVAVRQLAERTLRDVVPSTHRFSIELLGMRGDQAKILFSRHERLPVSAQLLEDREVGRAIEEAVSVAERAVQALRDAVRRLAQIALSPGDRLPDAKDVTHLALHLGAERVAWGALTPHFDAFLAQVATDRDGALNVFAEAVRREVVDAHASAARDLGAGTRALHAGASSEVTLRARLKELLTTNTEVS